jgi:outer membrane protein TolC
MPNCFRRARAAAILPPILALILAGGCRVDQDKEVSRYRRVLQTDAAATTRPIAPGAPLTLIAALDLANHRNEQLAIEGENYLQAMIDRHRAVANFLPTLNLAPSWSLRDRGSSDDSSNSNNSRTHTLDAPVAGTINLFNGFRDVAKLKAADLTIDQRRSLLLDLQEQVLLDTAQVYYQVLQAERSVQVLENSLNVQEARVRDIVGRQQAGVARPLDVAQTEAQASATRVSLIDARNDVRNGRAALAFLTAAPVEDSALIDRLSLPASVLPLPRLLDLAQQRRRDVQAAHAAVAVARQNVDAAFGQYYPSIALDVDAYLYRETIPDDRKWEALLRANLPIFSAGIIEADVRNAWSVFRQAQLSESRLRRQVRQDVETAYENLNDSTHRLAELKFQLQAANQAFLQAEQSYNVGLATNLERVTAQDQLLRAQLQLAGEGFNRTLFYLSLARATGTLRDRYFMALSAAATQPATAPTTLPSLSGQ